MNSIWQMDGIRNVVGTWRKGGNVVGELTRVLGKSVFINTTLQNAKTYFPRYVVPADPVMIRYRHHIKELDVFHNTRYRNRGSTVSTTPHPPVLIFIITN